MMGGLLPSDSVWSYCRNAAAILGTVFIGRIVLHQLWGLLNGFRAFFLAPMGIGRLNLRKYGNWAVVTGASEGIGKAYALELAKRGMNVVLMSRSEEKLNKVATEIKEKYGRDTRVIPVDFSDGFEIYAPLAEQLSSLDIGVLVNNVGYSHGMNFMGDIPADKHYRVVQINCQAVVQMSRILLPKMTAKGGGVIVNVSSGASVIPFACLTVYCATKKYVNCISEGMRKEYGGRGIIVQNVQPQVVVTAMARDALGKGIQSHFFAPTPATFARAAVATIGIQDDTHGCFSHALQGQLMKFIIPTFLLDMTTTAMVKKRQKAHQN